MSTDNHTLSNGKSLKFYSFFFVPLIFIEKYFICLNFDL
ncbi:hypothetical protein URS_2862 [Acinetobacter ursingii]|nr:hypothetical protein URS_2862 [Acinetobacter ursingii]